MAVRISSSRSGGLSRFRKNPLSPIPGSRSSAKILTPNKGTEPMGLDSEGKRKPYIPPQIKPLTEDEARRLLEIHAHQGNEEAALMLQTLDGRTPRRLRFRILESA